MSGALYLGGVMTVNHWRRLSMIAIIISDILKFFDLRISKFFYFLI